MAFGREALPAELAQQVRHAAANLGLVTVGRSGQTQLEWHLTDDAARFVGDRQYERVHPDEARTGDQVAGTRIVHSGTPTKPARIELLHTPECPNWVAASIRLSIALQVTGREDVPVHVRRITSPPEAARAGFTGSPMIRFDGEDPFADPGLAVGLSCRVYREDGDVVGAPTVGQLVDALLACDGP